MIAIAGRLRVRAAEPNTHVVAKDILICIATEIEEELEVEKSPKPPIIVTDENKETT